MTETKRANWYEGKTGNHQGLIIEEGTGKNIAVCYDKADAPLIAAAPELLAVLKKLEDIISGIEAEADNLGTDLSEARYWWKKAGDVIYKAEGGN